MDKEMWTKKCGRGFADKDLRRQIFVIRITVETNFCGDEEMRYEELRIGRNVRQRTARPRNAKTKICG